MKLYKLTTGAGEYWTIAEHPTEAENKVKTYLNETNTGTHNDRDVSSIAIIASAPSPADKKFAGYKLIL